MSLWIVPSVSSVLLLAGLAILLWVRRPPPVLWPAIFLTNVGAVLWVLGDLGTYFTTELWQEEIAITVLFTGSIITALGWWSTSLAYLRSNGLGWAWLGSRWAKMPLALGALCWLVMVTNHWHGQFITPVVGGRNVGHWAVLATAAVTYPSVACASILFFVLSRKSRAPDIRTNAAILSLATAAPLLCSIAYTFGPWRQVPIDFAGVGLTVGGFAIVYGISRNRLFSLLPIALPEVLRHDPSGLLLIDASERLVFWNPAVNRLLPGLPLDADLELFPALARRLRMPGDDKPIEDVDGLAGALLDDRQPEDGHLFEYAPAIDRWLRITSTPVPSRRGVIVAHALRISDVTLQRRADRQRRNLESHVQHVEKLKSLGVLAGGIAHDFNNLLTVILGNVSLALDDLSERDPLRAPLQDVEEVATDAALLTQQLLAYSGRARFEAGAVDLSALIEEMSRLLEVTIPAKVRLERELAADLPPLEGDPSQLRQVVVNLVSNAAESMGVHTGRVVVRTFAIDDEPRRAGASRHGQKLAGGPYVVLEVEDDGCGMDEETRSRIFEPFYTTKFRGRGLGMAAAFGVIRSHGGAIRVDSEPGRGTTMRVLFPVTAELAASADPEDARVPSESTWRSSGRVLVIDDEPHVRRVAASILERAGFKVTTAAGGEEGLEKLRAARGEFRLVLLDLTMPGMSGEQTLRELRRFDAKVHVLLSSGYDESDAMGRIPASAQPSPFIHKPYRFGELLAAVRAALGE